MPCTAPTHSALATADTDRAAINQIAFLSRNSNITAQKDAKAMLITLLLRWQVEADYLLLFVINLFVPSPARAELSAKFLFWRWQG